MLSDILYVDNKKQTLLCDSNTAIRILSTIMQKYNSVCLYMCVQTYFVPRPHGIFTKAGIYIGPGSSCSWQFGYWNRESSQNDKYFMVVSHYPCSSYWTYLTFDPITMMSMCKNYNKSNYKYRCLQRGHYNGMKC